MLLRARDPELERVRLALPVSPRNSRGRGATLQQQVLPTPPPRREPFDIDSPRPSEANKAVAPPETDCSMEVSMSPLAVLGGGVACTS